MLNSDNVIVLTCLLPRIVSIESRRSIAYLLKLICQKVRSL